MRTSEIRRRSAELVAAKDIRAAGDLVAGALAIQPLDSDLLIAKANIMLAGRQYRQAIDTLTKLTGRRPELADAHFLLGNVYRATRVPRQAVRCYEATLAIDADYPGAHHYLGLARQQLGDLRGAEAALERACELRPELALLRYRLGAVQHLQDRHEPAIAAYRQALRRDPAHHGSHSNLALALLALGRDGEALEATRQHLAHVPGHALALASMLYAALGAGDRALVDRLLDHERLLACRDLGRGVGRGLAQASAQEPSAPAGEPGEAEGSHLLEAAAAALLTLPLALGDPTGSFTTREFGPEDDLPPSLVRALEQITAAVTAHFDACRRSADDAEAHPWISALPERWRLRCWGEGHDAVSREPTHCHPRAVLSGLLYLEVPPGDDARVRFNVGDEPYHERAPAAVEERAVANGRLLLFPAYYFHHTVPAPPAERRRLRIAFDVLRA